MGKHSTYTWDKSAFEEEAITWNDETVVNWSEVGKRYDIRDKSGKVAKYCGQIAKDYLLNREESGFVFTFSGNGKAKEVTLLLVRMKIDNSNHLKQQILLCLICLLSQTKLLRSEYLK